MLRRFSSITVIFCTILIITVMADERENISSDELEQLLEKLGRLLKGKEYDKFRTVNPGFLNALRYWNDNELVKERSPIESTNEDQVVTSSNDDVSDSTFQFLPTWSNEDRTEHKRAYHRALCHFKLCNMGSKRSRFYWNMVRRRNT